MTDIELAQQMLAVHGVPMDPATAGTCHAIVEAAGGTLMRAADALLAFEDEPARFNALLSREAQP